MCLNSVMRQRHTTVRFFGESPRKGEEARESKADRSGGCKRRTRLRRGAFHRDDKFWNLQARGTDARRCEPRESFRAKYFSSTTGGATRRSLSSRGVSNWLLNKQCDTRRLIRLRFCFRKQRELQYVQCS